MLAAAALLVLAACGTGADQQAEISGPADTRPPSIVAPTTTTTAPLATVSPSRSTTTLRAVATSASPGSSAPAPTRAPGPAALGPAAAGAYQYDTSGQTTLGTGAPTPYPAVTSLVIDPPVGNRQHGVRDLRDPSRNGPVFDSTFEYRPDGLYLVNLSATITVLVFSDTEAVAPSAPVLLLATGAAPGYHRDLDLPTASGGVAHLALDVVRTEQVKGVATRVLHIAATLPGQYNARLDLTIWLAPNSLWLREHVTADASAAGIAFHTAYDATLRG